VSYKTTTPIIEREAGHHLLTSVILATQEADIRRIQVRSQPGAKRSQDPMLKNPSQKRVCGVAQDVGPEFKPQYFKKKKKKRVLVRHGWGRTET
jgi:hypothetical protein